jgi:hypothetical protein
MKNIFKSVLFTAMVVALFSSCTKDSDYEVYAFKPMIFSDDFSVVTDGSTSLTQRGWTVFTEAGSRNWTEGIYGGDAYAVFTSYAPVVSPPYPGDPVNISWLISPPIDMDKHEGEKLLFQAAQAYVSSSANSLEVFISSDFDGDPTHVLSSTWTPLPFNPPTTVYFEYANSSIDLSQYTGNIHIAFKVKGSGTNTALDGTYQIDNVRVIY